MADISSRLRDELAQRPEVTSVMLDRAEAALLLSEVDHLRDAAARMDRARDHFLGERNSLQIELAAERAHADRLARVIQAVMQRGRIDDSEDHLNGCGAALSTHAARRQS